MLKLYVLMFRKMVILLVGMEELRGGVGWVKRWKIYWAGSEDGIGGEFRGS